MSVRLVGALELSSENLQILTRSLAAEAHNLEDVKGFRGQGVKAVLHQGNNWQHVATTFLFCGQPKICNYIL
jgi:hypothetical protein